MGIGSPAPRDEDLVSKLVESAIRIGILFVLASWCFQIMRPFVIPVVWGIVLAIAMYPAHRSLNQVLGGDRRALAAAMLAILMLVVLVIPAVVLTETVLSGAETVASGLQAGTFHVAPPPDAVREWPLVGPRVHAFWLLLSENIGSALAPIRPQLETFGRWLVSVAASTWFGLLIFLVAIIISAVLMSKADAGARFAQAVGRRLAGDRGQEFIDVAGATVRSVARGILGVAMIQAVLAGIGFLAVGVPGAGLWALVVMFLSIIQVGMLPIGVPVPMLIIFVGAIGGFLSAGIVGLFVGSVVLALGYRLFLPWLGQEVEASKSAT